MRRGLSLDSGSVVLLAGVALTVGVFIGTSGIGGVLLIPVLVHPVGLSVHHAVATALASFLFIGSAGTWLFARRGSLEWQLIWPVCAGAAFAGYIGARFAAQIEARPLALVIGLLIIGASVLILRPPPVLAPRGVRAPRRERLVLGGVGLTAGFGSGLSGAGGPIFSVPLMIALGFPPLATVGAAQGLQIVAALSGSAANLQAGAINAHALALIVVFQLAGLVAGVRLAHALSSAALRQVAAWLCVGAGVLMVFRAV
ncbi:MAG: sulfite exporter TauE/SafE family protein [Betaproteobacteria bacterium]|nr:MAG: sulfite exporter TauE/SafE family protein [Betaproteobacteria bacterium]